MGWQSDWLYQLVFAEVERVWHRACLDGQGNLGPAPDVLLVYEASEADWERVRCRYGVRRRWSFRGGQPELLSGEASAANDLGERRGMFYERGRVEFCVAADRARVLLTYTLGPRYGRGAIFDVVGQGTRGRLAPGAGESWVS